MLKIGVLKRLINIDDIFTLPSEKTHMSRTKITFKEAVSCTMDDAVAKGVSKVVECGTDVFKMHQENFESSSWINFAD